jgi:hypothetical protein
MFVNIKSGDISGESISQAVIKAAEDYEEPIPGAKKRLIKMLEVMAYADLAAVTRKKAEQLLSHLG